jgi:S-methylmethionine-dependent homocysteine/selenocysteine methylase
MHLMVKGGLETAMQATGCALLNPLLHSNHPLGSGPS